MINRDFFIHTIIKSCYNILSMQVDYTKLWERYKEKGYKNKTDLIELANISTNIVAKLNKGEYVSMESLAKICKALDCDFGDVCVINKNI